MFENENPGKPNQFEEQKIAVRLAVEYWRTHILADAHFNPEWECLAVIHLDAVRKIIGHHFVVNDPTATPLVHPREVFRPPIEAEAAAVILLRHETSVEPAATATDIRVARHLLRAGELLRIEVLDYVIAGDNGHASLRSLGHFES